MSPKGDSGFLYSVSEAPSRGGDYFLACSSFRERCVTLTKTPECGEHQWQGVKGNERIRMEMDGQSGRMESC